MSSIWLCCSHVRKEGNAYISRRGKRRAQRNGGRRKPLTVWEEAFSATLSGYAQLSVYPLIQYIGSLCQPLIGNMWPSADQRGGIRRTAGIMATASSVLPFISVTSVTWRGWASTVIWHGGALWRRLSATLAAAIVAPRSVMAAALA